jgi:arsenite-transporting ATPase
VGASGVSRAERGSTASFPAAELAARTRARFVFVVGKGGVGKSTTASALALALADAGEKTHLVSTDPAHSIGDVFDVTLAASAPASACSPRLTLEEIDASARARLWLAEVSAPIADVVERGTYLDAEDVAALLDCSLPGMDEVMAALRLGELVAETAFDRIVVDTAPTGHTLRLFDCGRVIDAWADAIEAMAAKAGAVAAALTGRRPHFEGEAVVERVRADVRRFEEQLAHGTDLVVVTRAEEVVSAETRRLLDHLRGRGWTIAAVVAVGGGSTDAGYGIPIVRVGTGRDGVGCAALRSWGAGPSERPMPPGMAGRGPDDVLRAIPPRPLMFFAGKGGVGKSTCAAAYAISLARERDVLLVSTDPAGSLGDVFGVPVDAAGTRVAPRLVARQVDAEADFARFRRTHRENIRAVFADLGLKDTAVLDRRVLESIVDMAPPGLDEIFAVQAILDGQGAHDVMIVDTAPTGHFLRLLEMPETALAWTRALLRVLLKYRSVLSLDGLAQDLLVWAKQLKSLLQLLADPARSGVVVVTMPETLARRETDRLLAALRRESVPVAAVVQNRWTSDASAADPQPRAPQPWTVLLSPLLPIPPVGADALEALADRWRIA